MYCGCNEKALDSQTRIACSLLALMERKPYAAISVTELCREAGVSRPTFYSRFDSMDDVVIFLLQSRYSYAPEEDPSDCAGLEAICRGYSRYIVSQRHFLSMLVNNNIGYILHQSIFRALMDCGCFLSGAEPSARRYAADFTAGGLTGIIRSYVTQEDCSADVMDELIRTLFSGAFFGL